MFVQIREAEAERRRKVKRENSFQPPPTKTDSKVDTSKGTVDTTTLEIMYTCLRV